MPMTYSTRLVLIAVFCFLASQLFITARAESADSLAINDATINTLGLTENWYRQLYLVGQNIGPSRARVQDDSFYFSTGPIIDPVVELAATLTAFTTDLDAIDDQHPICQFPSRFLFLQQELGLLPEIQIRSHCQMFADWADLSADSHISVVMVDGYYGNPASSFGHLIVRIGRDGSASPLLDRSFNYGADVPESDGTLTYIVKGLLGGYQAGFTQENFYRQDLVYTRNEYRDMWNYQLALTDKQELLFVAHVWELLGHPATYYFVKNNCAFAIAETLEFVLDRDLVDQGVLWYAPAALFQKLDRLDAEDPGHLVTKREFVPSQKRQLANLLDALTTAQSRVMRRYLDEDGAFLSEQLAQLSDDDASAVLEALIEYHDYLIRGYPEIGTDLYERRRQLLIARLALPAGQHLQVDEIEPGTPVGYTAQNSRIGLGAVYTADDISTVFGFTPYQHSPTDRGNEDLSELTALHTEIAVTEDAAELHRFTAIRVSQRSDWRQQLPEQWLLSWEMEIAADCVLDCQPTEGLLLSGGLGQSVSIGTLMFSALSQASLTGRKVQAGLDLEVGLPEHWGWSTQSSLGYWLPVTEQGVDGWVVQSDIRFSPNTRHSLLLNTALMNDDWQAQLNWQWHYR
ncbi:DUF4105 domain-containing protein [Saccharospirillum sp. HFRX-1]|uniref:Lnb N-terminal periplasmic domain-containing protein n=1 Tax=unclassified Saccharospirillum TaxID=2633430 RepID=UPI00371C7D5A